MAANFRITSQTVLFAVSVFMAIQFFAVRRWSIDTLWDHEMKSYYAYLPATFILNDPALEKTEMTPYYHDRFYGPQPGPLRGRIQKTTMGVALLQVPFFLVGQSMAINFDFAVDGYSQPYKQMSVLAALFYAFLGLVLLRKTLLRFFTDSTVIWTLLSLFLGTNLYYYSLYEGQMSHVYSFFLVSALVYLTVSWHAAPKMWKMLLLGAVMGFIVLIRPVNGCLGLFFLLYRDSSQATLGAKSKLLWAEWKSLLAAAACFLLVLAPQLLYWKYTSGQWFFYSYGNQSLYWLRPKIWLGLFSYQKGWLVWTPMGWFAVLGLFFLRKNLRPLLWPVLASAVVYVYVIFCWWCWWYGGSFGMRAMIDVLPVLALPMAALLQQIGRTRLLALPVLAVWLFLVVLNLFQTNQYVTGRMHWAGTTKKMYWGKFLNNHPKENYDVYAREPNVEQAMRGETGLD